MGWVEKQGGERRSEASGDVEGRANVAPRHRIVRRTTSMLTLSSPSFLLAGAFREMAKNTNHQPSSLSASADPVSAVVGADGAQLSFAPAHGDGRECSTLGMKVGWLP